MFAFVSALYLFAGPPAEKPTAYLIDKSAPAVVELLQTRGVAVLELREDVLLDVRNSAGKLERRAIEAGTFVAPCDRLDAATVAELERTSKSANDGTAAPSVLALCDDNPLHTQTALGQGKHAPKPMPLTLDTVFQGDEPLSLDGDPNEEFEWIDDEHLLMRKGGPWLKVEAQTGRAQSAENTEELKKALTAIPSLGKAGAAAGMSGRRQFTAQRDAFSFAYANDLYYATLDGKTATRLTATPAVEETPLFSPDGKWIAFVREDNLYVVDVATRTERALTTDGGGVIRNGKADWVYWEEIWDRNARPFWWSPDSGKIAFLRFDDTHVPKFTIVNELPVHQKLEQTHYPKVGDANPIVKLGLATVAGGDLEWVNIPADADRAVIISRVGWRPTGDVYFTVQDRIQTKLDLYFHKPGAEPKRTVQLKNPKGWVEYNTEPTFLADGSFVLPSEHTGYRHLYLYSPTGSLKATLTSGDWEVRRVAAVDEKTGFVTFVGMKDDPIGEATYRVKLDGTGLEKTAAPVGSRRRVSFSPNRQLFVESWSDHRTPPQVMLYHASGRAVRTIDANPVHAQEKAQLAPMEFVKVPMKDGFSLEGYIVRPSKFDAKKKYPVWTTVYGGPRMPQVRRSFDGGRMMSRMVADTGLVVFCVDPRSASGKGAASAWAAYRQLGVQESKDIAEAVAWLVEKHPYCDAKRVGIEGTSYGGYMTAYCMTHTKTFAAGVAAAAVTDWHNYDSIYTERYMSTPADNPEGYAAGSVVKAAGDLSGKLLIVHGMMDDNVHPQNAMQFVYELQKANKDFELMVYPTARHGGFGRHFTKLKSDFIKRALGGPTG